MKPLPFKMNQQTDIEKYRARTFFTKEPETIAWINDFPAGSLLIDVGANIGVYSLYAASQGHRVCAVEPMIENFKALVDNIILNDFPQIITLFAAAGNRNFITRISVPHKIAGATGAQMGEVGYTVPMMRVDKLLQQETGNIFVKIDIDGLEMQVIEGIDEQMKSVRSLLVEFDHDKNEVAGLDWFMEKFGMRRDKRYMDMPNHSSTRRGGNPENIIYTREGYL